MNPFYGRIFFPDGNSFVELQACSYKYELSERAWDSEILKKLSTLFNLSTTNFNLSTTNSLIKTDSSIGLILWSSDLRSVTDEATAIKRNRLAGTDYIFGNMQEQLYSKGGWKKTLFMLMKQCMIQAKIEGKNFQPFSLQDCRPKGVSYKLAQGHLDVMDATLHTSERMVKQTYDRRKVRIAKPTR